MSKIHLELLDKNRLAVFKKLAAFAGYGYLAGGTALALQIAHRKSFDFDVFVEKPIANRLRLEVSRVFGAQNYLVNTEDQLTFTLGNISEITFLWYYWKPIAPCIPTQSLSLAALKDIAADKAATLGRRAVWRDYVDLFVLLKHHDMTVKSLIQLAEKKFQGDFVATQCVEQLGYFGDITVAPIEFIGPSYSAKEIQAYLRAQVSQYVATILPT